MLVRSREAPTTATARGSSMGRSDAAVAMRVRSSDDATLSNDGVSESCTSRQPPPDFDRISNPESRNTSSMAVLSVSVVAWKREKPLLAASTASRSSSAVASPFPWN